MKAIFILIMSISLSYGSLEIKEQHELVQKHQRDIFTVCVEGYKFLVVTTENGVSTVQVYEARSGTKPARPVECN